MYRTSSREPRYKHSTLRKKHDESENSSSENEDSSDSRAEDSDDTTASKASESFRKGSAFSADSICYHQRRAFTRHNLPDSFLSPYTYGSRVIKHDKVTQKNLLSPFPSFTIPPIHREVTAQPYKMSKPTSGKHIEARNSRAGKRSPRGRDGYEENEESLCYIHNSCEPSNRRHCEKQKNQKDGYRSREKRAEQVFTCVSSNQDSSVKCPPEIPVKGTPQPPPLTSVNIRSPKTADRETLSSTKCQESLSKSRRKSTSRARPSVSDPQGEVLTKDKRNGKAVGDCGGEVREKLVYVVEQEGKDVKKIETDLFTLNEILAIKKDLLELSEFAKKLKKLKEMRKESENSGDKQNSCKCKPVAELLRSVNRRIEVLEARQEDLEKGLKVDPEAESKKTWDFKQSPSDSQSKTAPTAVKTSETTTIPSFPRMEGFAQRDELSNNSDIVNELMDIKTQLHKLEQKKMTEKTASEDVTSRDTVKIPKKEEHAIAVYSSRTYILTDNFDKRKQGIKAIVGEKQNYYSTGEESRKDQTEEHVANWLRNVTPKNPDISYLPPSRLKNLSKGGNGKADIKCKNCSEVLKVEDIQNQGRYEGMKIALHTIGNPINRNSLRLNNIQEPRKNRAIQEDGRIVSDVSFSDFEKNDCPGILPSQTMKFKECIVTPSGKIFACVNSSSGRDTMEQRQIESSCLTPTAILTKEYAGKSKTEAPALPMVIKTCNVQELSGNLANYKAGKSVWNMKLKNVDKMSPKKQEKRKDGKNQCLKLLEAHLLALRKTLRRNNTSTGSTSYSEFLASINLEVTSSETSKLNGNGDNRAMVMTYAATARMDGMDDEVHVVDNCDKMRKNKVIEKEKQIMKKRKQAECKKMLKKKLQEQKKSDAIRKKREEKQQKCEIKKLKRLCKELNYSDDLKEFWTDGTKKEGGTTDESTPKKSQSSEECTNKKCRALKKSYSSDEVVHKKGYFPENKRTFLEEAKKRCCNVEVTARNKQLDSKHITRYKRQDEDYPRMNQPQEKKLTSKKQRREEEFAPKNQKQEERVSKYQLRGEERVPKHQKQEEERVPKYQRREEEPTPKHRQQEVERVYKYQRQEEQRVPRYQRREGEVIPQYKRQNDKRVSRYRRQLQERPPTKQLYEEDTKGYRYDEENTPMYRYRYEDEKNFRRPNSVVGPNYPRQHYKQEESTSSSIEDYFQDCRKRNKGEDDSIKMNQKNKNQSIENCKLKQMIKQLGRLKINLPFADEFCDGKHTNCRRSKTPEKPKKPKESSEKNRYGFSLSRCDDEDFEAEHDCMGGYNSRSVTPHEHQIESNEDHHYRQRDRYNAQDYHQINHQRRPQEHHSNCRCVQVYLQSQAHKGWPGLGPFRKLTSESETAETTSKTGVSSVSNKTCSKPQIFHVMHSSEHRKRDHRKRRKKEKKVKKQKYKCKCHKHHSKCKCHKHHSKCKCHKHHSKCECKRCKMLEEDHCKCKKCGNVHNREHHKEVKKHEEHYPPEPESSIKGKKGESDATPLFSFLNNFCKLKPRNPKTLGKLSEVRHLKMCESRKRDPKRQDMKKGNSSLCFANDSPCNCKPRMNDIESRISELESKEFKKTKKSLKKKKKRRKSCSRSSCDSRSMNSVNLTESEGDKVQLRQRHSERKHRRLYEENRSHEKYDDKYTKHKEGKRRKKHYKCCDDEIETDSIVHKKKSYETAAYYQSMYCPTFVDIQNNSTSDTSKSPSIDLKASFVSAKDVPPQMSQRIKEGLTSLHSFWRNIRKISNGKNGMESLMNKLRKKKSFCEPEPNIGMVEDYSEARIRELMATEARAREKGKSKEERREERSEKLSHKAQYSRKREK